MGEHACYSCESDLFSESDKHSVHFWPSLLSKRTFFCQIYQDESSRKSQRQHFKQKIVTHLNTCARCLCFVFVSHRWCQ